MQAPQFRSRRLWSTLARVGFALSLMSAIGCAETVRKTAKEATPEAVEGAIETAHDPENRRDIAQVMNDPKIREASAALTRAVVGGALDAFTSEQRMDHLEKFSEAFMERMSAGIVKSMSAELRPQIAAMVAESTDRALERVLSEQTQQRAADFTVAVSRAAIRGVAEELEAKDPTHVGNPNVAQDRLGHLAQRASQGFAFGFQEAVNKSEARGDKRGEVLAAVGQTAKASRDIFSVGGLIAIGVFLVLAAGLVWSLIRARSLRQKSEQRENELLRLLSAHPELRSEARV
jgi:hypothetical protein